MNEGAALVELANLLQPFLDRAKAGDVEPAGSLLAVAGQERRRAALTEQTQHPLHLLFPAPQLPCNPSTVVSIDL